MSKRRSSKYKLDRRLGVGQHLDRQSRDLFAIAAAVDEPVDGVHEAVGPIGQLGQVVGVARLRGAVAAQALAAQPGQPAQQGGIVAMPAVRVLPVTADYVVAALGRGDPVGVASDAGAAAIDVVGLSAAEIHHSGRHGGRSWGLIPAAGGELRSGRCVAGRRCGLIPGGLVRERGLDEPGKDAEEFVRVDFVFEVQLGLLT